MKTLIGHDIGQYEFNAAAQTITFNGLPPFALEQILLITNENPNIIIYNFADPTPNGGILVGNVLTLDFNTTSMLNTDPLQIYIDLPTTAPNDNAAMNDAYTHLLLQRICDLLEPMATQDVAQRQRVTIDAITGSLTLGTVSTVTGVTAVTTLSTISNPVPVGNIATLGGGNPEWTFIDIARQSYAIAIRSQLQFGN
jgi:hypothetical protein